MLWNMREPVNSEHSTTKCDACLYGSEVILMVMDDIDE